MARFPSGSSLAVFDTLDSTSLEAKRAIEAGEPGPRWILALTQTAGYGRRGRDWEQRAGDFAGTLFFKPDAAPERLGQLSFIAALALTGALDEIIAPEKITLKWPNDVLLDGEKCAGILLENVTAGTIGGHLAIGIGINLITAPPNLPYPAARLIDHVSTLPAPPDLAARIDAHFWRLYEPWRVDGFSAIREAWLARAAGLGSTITVRLPNEEISGVFEGLDETGGLMLRIAAGKRIIAAGEVFF